DLGGTQCHGGGDPRHAARAARAAAGRAPAGAGARRAAPRAQRALSLRQRAEVQEVLRRHADGALRRGGRMANRTAHRLAGTAFRALALLLLPALALAQAPPAVEDAVAEAEPGVPADPAGEPPVGPPAAGERARRDAELAAFADGLVRGVLARDRIPGMVVAVVDRVGSRLVQGYGFARLDPPLPADGERSLFRIGSVSKTFTYVLAMQLVEQGRIHLDDPIDLHLPPPLRVPDDGFAQPLR